MIPIPMGIPIPTATLPGATHLLLTESLPLIANRYKLLLEIILIMGYKLLSEISIRAITHK